MNKISQKKLQQIIDNFNNKYKVGDKVEVWQIKGVRSFEDEIKHEATIMGGHTPVTWLKEKGSYDLTFVKGMIKDN